MFNVDFSRPYEYFTAEIHWGRFYGDDLSCCIGFHKLGGPVVGDFWLFGLRVTDTYYIMYVYSNFSDLKTAEVRWSTWQSTMGGTYMVFVVGNLNKTKLK